MGLERWELVEILHSQLTISKKKQLFVQFQSVDSECRVLFFNKTGSYQFKPYLHGMDFIEEDSAESTGLIFITLYLHL